MFKNDYWLNPLNMINNISSCAKSPTPLTDHCSVTLVLSLIKGKAYSTTNRTFYSNLLLDKDFCTNVRKRICDSSLLELTPLNNWEWFKFNVRAIAIRYDFVKSNER